MVRITHPSLFHKIDALKRQEDLCSEDKEKSVHSHIHPALGLNVSLHGGIPPRRPPDWKMNKVFSQHGATLIYLAREGALGGAITAQRTLHGFKGGVRNLLIWTLLSPTQPFALKDDS